MPDDHAAQDDILSVVPDIPTEIAVGIMRELLGMDGVQVTWRDAIEGELPPDRDGKCVPFADGPLHCVAIVRPGIQNRERIWIIGHEMLHHCQRFRLWPPEEEFVETIDLLLMYALRGALGIREGSE